MIKLNSVNRGSVVHQIIKSVQQAISNKELKPGDPFPSENEMVKSLGVSKSSVREAVKMLEAMNVVTIQKGEGTFVCSSMDNELINPMLFTLLLQQEPSEKVVELRLMFEPAYSLLAMENQQPEDIEIIQSTIDAFGVALKSGTLTVDHDMAFHRAVLEATHNNFVIKIGKVILELFVASVKDGLFDEPKRSLYHHERILDALVKRDDAVLRETISHSVQWWKRF